MHRQNPLSPGDRGTTVFALDETGIVKVVFGDAQRAVTQRSIGRVFVMATFCLGVG